MWAPSGISPVMFADANPDSESNVKTQAFLLRRCTICLNGFFVLCGHPQGSPPWCLLTQTPGSESNVKTQAFLLRRCTITWMAFLFYVGTFRDLTRDVCWRKPGFRIQRKNAGVFTTKVHQLKSGTQMRAWFFVNKRFVTTLRKPSGLNPSTISHFW